MESAKASAQAGPKLAFWRRLGLFVGLPALFYFAFFCFYSYPWITHFSSAFFSDAGDGLQNVWNIWWINKAITQLHHSPWWTGYLHYPYGVSLLGQTLNPINGFLSIPLLRVFSLVQTYNLIVILAFVGTGLTTFWLCYHLSRSYAASLVGGFIVTFSSYHFAHAAGHLQLVTMEWIPLFILLWIMLLQRPRYWLALAAAAALLLVEFSDLYYLFYSVIMAGIIFIFYLIKRRIDLRSTKTLFPLLTFGIVALALTGPLLISLLRLNAHDPLLGAHDASLFSMDLFAPFIYGSSWKFAGLTRWFWFGTTGPARDFGSEISVYLGFSVLALWVLALVRRKRMPDLALWASIALVFGILSLGPRLRFFGHTVNSIPMPYAVLAKLIPSLQLSGVPVRMMAPVFLASAVVAALVLSKIDWRRYRIGIGLLLALLFVECWPGTLFYTPAVHQKYVDVLKSLPAGGVVDNAAPSQSIALYDQTIDEKPEALGYISRTPTSVNAKDAIVVNEILTDQYGRLCPDFRLRYFTTPAYRPLDTSFPVIYKDRDALIYDLKDAKVC